MSCPRCGGVDRTEIAPSYWRCNSVIVRDREGPGFRDPYAGPPVLYDTEICGKEYMAASVTSTGLGYCRCDTGAIGRCSECKQPVCGDHSGLWHGHRLCGEHYKAKVVLKQSAEARARWEQQQALYARMDAEKREKERQAAELLTVETEARPAVLEVLEKLRKRGCPGSVKQKLYKGGYNHFIDHYRRRGWLLHTSTWVDSERHRQESKQYWVTNHGEYIDDHWRISVAHVDLLKCLRPEYDKLGPFGQDPIPELRWSGILKTLRSHL